MIKNIQIHHATDSDIDAILSLYDMVSISIKPKKVTSLEDSLEYFSLVGGIFHDEPVSHLLKMILGEEYIVFVARVQETNKVVGYYSVRKDIPNNVQIKLNSSLTNKDWVSSFHRAFKKQSVAFSLDTIIHPDYRRLGIATQLKRKLIEHLRRINYTHLLIEIFTIKEVWDTKKNDLPLKVNIPNSPSIKLHKKLGARLIGEVEHPKQLVEYFQVTVSSSLYSIDLSM